LSIGVPPRGHRPLLGIALILIMAACFAVLDTNAKRLGALMPVLVVLWARYAFQAVVMTLWLLHRKRRVLMRAVHPRFQIVRGLLLLIVSALGFYALQHMPVAEFTAVVMLTPVLVTVLAVVVLKEPITLLRAALVVGGLSGALIIVRPGSGLFGWAALIPALAALCYAAFQLLTRRLAGIEHPLTTHFYTGLVGTAVASAALVATSTALWPVLSELEGRFIALLLLVGLLGTVGHLLLILAMGTAPVALLMPFTYAQIVFAMGAGWIAFRHVPDGWALIGMAVIAACGAASVWLNARESARTRVPDSTVAADAIGD
jgi:drug/metabolite transporter (DMT)-like permease